MPRRLQEEIPASNEWVDVSEHSHLTSSTQLWLRVQKKRETVATATHPRGKTHVRYSADGGETWVKDFDTARADYRRKLRQARVEAPPSR